MISGRERLASKGKIVRAASLAVFLSCAANYAAAAEPWSAHQPIWEGVSILDCKTETKVQCRLAAGAQCEQSADRDSWYVDFKTDSILGRGTYGVKIRARTFRRHGTDANAYEMKLFLEGGREPSQVMSLRYRLSPDSPFAISNEIDAITMWDFAAMDVTVHRWTCVPYVKKN